MSVGVTTGSRAFDDFFGLVRGAVPFDDLFGLERRLSCLEAGGGRDAGGECVFPDVHRCEVTVQPARLARRG